MRLLRHNPSETVAIRNCRGAAQMARLTLLALVGTVAALNCAASTFDNGENECESCSLLQPPCDDCVCDEIAAKVGVQASCIAACLSPPPPSTPPPSPLPPPHVPSHPPHHPEKLFKESSAELSEETSELLNSEAETWFDKRVPTNTNYKELQSARRQMGPRRRLGGDDPLGTCDGGCKVWPAGWGHPAGVWNVNDDWYLGTLEEVCPQGCGCQHETGAKKAHCHRDKVSHWSTSASWSKISSPYGDGYCDHIPCDKGQGVTSPPPPPVCTREVQSDQCQNQGADKNTCAHYFYEKQNGDWRQCIWVAATGTCRAGGFNCGVGNEGKVDCNCKATCPKKLPFVVEAVGSNCKFQNANSGDCTRCP